MTERPSTNVFSTKLFIIILFFGLSSLGSRAMAELANSNEMDTACQNWLTLIVHNEGEWAGVTNPEIIGRSPVLGHDGTVLAYSYDISPKGFVVVPALKDLPPVKVYSDENDLDLSETDGMAQLVKDVIRDKSEAFEQFYGSLDVVQPDKGNILIDPVHRTQWDRFTETPEVFTQELVSKDGTETYREAGPLLTTTWHQGYPYNALCPMGDGGRCVVGCVATAASQIIWYWQWPPAGEGQHTYYWTGDNSCEGSSPGQYLTADFSDSYEYTETNANVSELCYEVGVAFDMYYGYCGSGAYTDDAVTVFPTYFRYRETINRQNRSSYTAAQWFMLIQNEIDAGRPMQYRINLHSIVCDGYKTVGTTNQFHMNYGWGGSNNSWYVIDGLYCPWDGCSPTVEYMIRGIEPDLGVMLYADSTLGKVPFQVEFTGTSDETVDNWFWDFGDGKVDTGNAVCTHEYEDPGVYDVSLKAVVAGDTNLVIRNKLITAVADSLKVGDAEGAVEDTVEVTISGNNTIPLNIIRIPVNYSGDINLRYVGVSTEGCRTDYFEDVRLIADDPANKRFVVQLQPSLYGGSAPNLEAGEGPLLKIKFRIHSGEPQTQNTIDISGFLAYQPLFSNGLVEYNPDLQVTVSMSYICGDVNSDYLVNVLDIIFLIDYKFKDGPAPDPLISADVNHDGLINVLDIIYLIDFKYGDGPEPQCQ